MRRRDTTPTVEDLPVWFVRFNPKEWPLTDNGPDGWTAGVKGRLVQLQAAQVGRLLDLGERETVQRSGWNHARHEWAQEQGVSLLELIRSRAVERSRDRIPVEGVYDHLRSPRVD